MICFVRRRPIYFAALVCLAMLSVYAAAAAVAQSTPHYLTREAALTGPAVGSAAGMYTSIGSAQGQLPSGGGLLGTAPNWSETDLNLDLGTSSKPVGARFGYGTTLNINGGNGTTGVRVFNASGIFGDGAANTFIKYTGSGAPLYLLANGQQNQTQEYYNVSKIRVNCNQGAFTLGCSYVDGVFVPSSFDDNIVSGCAGICEHITSTGSSGGGTNVFALRNDWLTAEFLSGGQPEVIDCSSGGVVSQIGHWGGAIEDPDTTHHAVAISGAGCSGNVFGIFYNGVQFQGNTSGTTSTFYATDAQQISVRDSVLNAQATGYASFEFAQGTSPHLDSILLENVRGSSNANTPVIQNDLSGFTSPSQRWLVPFYVYANPSGFAVAPTFDGLAPQFLNGANFYTGSGGATQVLSVGGTITAFATINLKSGTTLDGTIVNDTGNGGEVVINGTGRLFLEAAASVGVELTNTTVYLLHTTSACGLTTGSGGNIAAATCTGTGNTVLSASPTFTGTPITPNLQVTAIHSTSGNRYVCVDSSGNLVSSASACSGT